MQKNLFLVVTTVLGAAVCWWPAFIWQISPRHSSIPAVVALVFVALLTGFSTALSGGRWVRFWLLSSVATFLGVLSGGMIWPSDDGIAQSYLLFGAMLATAAVAVVSLFAVVLSWLLIRLTKN